MEIYLPIAEIPINIYLLLTIGFCSGIIAGTFGVGGGFITTPLLIFIGIPSPVAVASSINQILASSMSGFLAHFRRGNVDIHMGFILTLESYIGSFIGIILFIWLKKLDRIDIVISLLYIFILGAIGLFMIIKSIKEYFFQIIIPRKKVSKGSYWASRMMSSLPFKLSFAKSSIRVSVLIPIAIGVVSGILMSIMGIGGGFIVVPALIYTLGVPTSIVVGTSLFQIIFTATNLTLLYALTTQSVDIILAGILLITSTIGAQIGTRIGLRLPSELLKVVLACMILAMVVKFSLGFLITPSSLYTVVPLNN